MKADRKMRYGGGLGLIGVGLLVALISLGVINPLQSHGFVAKADVVSARANCVPVERDKVSKAGDNSDRAGCAMLGGPEPMAETAAREAQLGTIHGGAPGDYAAALELRSQMTTASGSTGWGPVGSPLYATDPQYNTVTPLGFGSLSGRISAITNDPSNPNRIFAAASNGGVWESTDAGASWHSVSDHLPTQIVGALAFSPANGGTLIAGTGDDSFGYYSYNGLGVYSTSNDGATWTHATGVPSDSLSFRVAIDPSDKTGKTVYVATSKGLYRSVDGGKTFVNINLPTTCTNLSNSACYFANVVTDVVVRAPDSNGNGGGAVMAVVGWRAGQRQAVNDDGSKGAPQSPQNGIYVSSNGKPNTFTFIPSGTSVLLGNGFAPQPNIGRVALGIANGPGQNHNIVYALVQDAQKLNGCLDQVDVVPACPVSSSDASLVNSTVVDGAYVTTDFGKTWTKIMDPTMLREPGTNSALGFGVEGYGPGIQGWYNLWIQPDPTATDAANGAPTRVLFGLEEVWENGNYGSDVTSTPTAATPWKVIGRYWNACAEVVGGLNCNAPPNPSSLLSLNNPTLSGSTIHPDQHAALFVPDGHGGVNLYVGSDGGMFKQHQAGGTDFNNDSWNSGPWGSGINNGLHTLQPYQAAISSDGTIVAGLQDNGEMKISPPDSNGQQTAEEIYGGDGFDTGIDPNNSANIAEEYAYGSISLTSNGGDTWYNVTPTLTSPLFWAPFQLDHAQASTSDPNPANHIVIGAREIQETTAGYNVSQYCADPTCQVINYPWTTVFDLGTHNHPGDASYNRPVATDSSDPDNSSSAIDVNGANIYVGFCGYCDRLYNPYFSSGIATNVGGSQAPQIGTPNGWHFAAAKGLPNRYITSIRMDPSNPKTVYVTLGGYGRRFVPPGALGDSTALVGKGHVFVSYDAGQTFHDVTGNLPNVPANWSLIHNGHLVVATDIGVFQLNTTVAQLQKAGSSVAYYSILGTGLPTSPVLSLQLQPGNPNHMIAALDGRGVYSYNF